MLYIVIEHFKNRDAATVYRRFREKGRMMPDGLVYIDSWIETNYDRCFQLMECEQFELFEQWTKNWDDIVDFGGLVKYGMISPGDLALFHRTNSVDEAYQMIIKGLTENALGTPGPVL